MFRFWLQFHPLLILLALLFIFAAFGSLVHWLQCRSPLRERIARGALGLPTFVAVSTLFALFAAFLLSGTITQKDRASATVQAESAALLGLGVYSESAHGGEDIRAAIRAYARSVVADEWPRLAQESSSSETERALLALVRVVRAGPAAGGLSSAVHGQMLSLVQKIVEARTDRIAIVAGHFQQFSWSALFLLGCLTQFSLGMGFLDRPSANLSAIVVFSLAAVIALWLIAIQDNPFRGPARVAPAMIEDAVRALRP
jgi:hypothetical protein